MTKNFWSSFSVCLLELRTYTVYILQTLANDKCSYGKFM
jgi:hypothetical protein